MAGGTWRGGASVQCRDRRPETLSWTAGASAATELMEAPEPGLVPAVYEHADTEAQCGNASRLGDVEPDSDTNCANDDEEQYLSARAIDGLRATSGVATALQRFSALQRPPPPPPRAAKHARRIPPTLKSHRPSTQQLAEHATHAESLRATPSQALAAAASHASSALGAMTFVMRPLRAPCRACNAARESAGRCAHAAPGSLMTRGDVRVDVAHAPPPPPETTLSSPLTAAPCVACDRRAASRKSTVVLRHLHAAPDLRAGTTPSNPRCRATSAGPSPDVSSLGTRSQHVPLATSCQDFPRKLCSCGRRRDTPHSSGAF
ncbi:hypothetical protein B0H15DRAFT_998406 [Mycena belliarum]|uniref:Uncharacterized protein n=1 Tax=Mycena belliarum TaxID=1033014 RepID=A0AAD6XXJ8_9AGAR|nr:hypothetical protein B0H15DRAFT_998406 [Mycena belliae]